MTDRKWHKGPPPHVGWWNASLYKNPRVWRWWDGDCWSFPAFMNDSPQAASHFANQISANSLSDIEWTHYYPTNARVPRIDPRKAK